MTDRTPQIDGKQTAGQLQFSSLSTRAKNVLKRRRICSLEDLRKLSSTEISAFMGIGKSTLSEIETLLIKGKD